MLRIIVPAALAAALTACLPAPPPPPAPYRAVGTEPFWSLVIDDREIAFIPADGAQVRQPLPRVIHGVAGEIYQTPRIGVNIIHAQCSDGMSDRTYPDKVQVSVDGRQFNGCGGDPIASASLAGSSWRVAAVNGRSTPPAGEYYVRFDADDRIGVKFGCNSAGGRYLQRGATVSVSNLAATRMACAEPAMSFENQGLGILSQPVIADWQGGDRLTLSNPNGRIELRRGY
ncbi:META domain-containing protein [Sphingomonas piscis]|uniref:META domain-containing protein n=1 Tax=Sphingomonas piscis TaxID=2714943 RepID=A0A6G7YSS2_9SPHN|nr:META domain-containing protein [Sphingomonas piscis]QIK79782.1 META domain-containing protein [Sphingomonas piscis]